MKTSPKLRTEIDAAIIGKLIQNNKFLKRYANTPEMINICKTLKYETFEKDNVIFK